MSAFPNRPARFTSAALVFAAFWTILACRSVAADVPPLVRSAHGGRWSAPDTWEGGKVPPAGARVQIRPGHVVVYDRQSDQAIRALFIAGMLTFAPDRDTRLDVGLIRIQAGDDLREEGFDCDAHLAEPDPAAPRPALKSARPTGPSTQSTRRRSDLSILTAWTSSPVPRSSAAAAAWTSTAPR